MTTSFESSQVDNRADGIRFRVDRSDTIKLLSTAKAPTTVSSPSNGTLAGPTLPEVPFKPPFFLFCLARFDKSRCLQNAADCH